MSKAGKRTNKSQPKNIAAVYDEQAMDVPELPEGLVIMGHVFAVKTSPTLFLSEGTAGTCDIGRQVITIDANVPESYQRSILLHEIMEALNSYMQIGLEHNQISAVTEGLFGVMRHNDLHFLNE